MPVTTASTPEEEIKESPLVTVNYNNGYSMVRVLEGDDTLTGLIKSKFNCHYTNSNLYLWDSRYTGTYSVIADTDQSALDWLANFGVLDDLLISKEEEESQIEEHGHVQGIRLGNAGEPFEIEYSCLQEVSLSDIRHIDCRLKFGGEGFLHLWLGSSSGPMDPIRDLVVRVTGDDLENFDFSGCETWGRDSDQSSTSEDKDTFLKTHIKNEIFNLISEYR